MSRHGKIHWRKGREIGTQTGCGLTTDRNFNIGNPNAAYLIKLDDSEDPRERAIVCARCVVSARKFIGAGRATVWVCPACGKTAEKRAGLLDSSCYLKAVKVWADTVVRDERGLVAKAEAAS